MSSVVKSTNGVTYTPSLVTLEDGEDINSVHLQDTDILSGQSIQQILNSGDADTLWQSGEGLESTNRKITEEKYQSTITGDYAVNLGLGSNISGKGSVNIGYNNNVGTAYSIVAGQQLSTSGNANFSANFGVQNKNSGQASLIFGNNNTNSGTSSIIGGGYGQVIGKNCLSITRGTYQTGLKFEKLDKLKYKISNSESSIDIYNIKIYLSDNHENIIYCRISQSDDSLCDATIQRIDNDYILSIVGDNFIEPTPQDNIYKFDLFFNCTSGNSAISIGNVISNSSDGSICTNKAVCNGDYGLCFGQSAMTGGENSMILGDFSISSGNSNVIFGGAHVYSNSTFAFGMNGYNTVLYLIGGQKNTKTYTVKIQSEELFNITHDIDKILVPGVILRCLNNNEFITAKIVNTEIINKGTINEDIQITTDVSLNPNSDISGKQIKVSLGMITQPNLGSNDLYPKMLIGQFVAALSKDGPQIVNGHASTSNGSSQLVSGYGLYSGDTKGESAFGILNYPTVGSGKTSADASLFTIGCGLQNDSSDPDTYNRNVLRRNALEVKRNGDIYIFGVGNYDGKRYQEAKTLQNIINNLSQSKQSLNLFEVQNIKDSLGEITVSSESAQDDYDYINFVFTGDGRYEFLAYRSSNNTYYRKWLKKKDASSLNIWNSSDYYQISTNMLLMCKNDGQLYYFVYSRTVSTQAPFRGYTPVYTLPTASSDILGGIRIGTGLSIDDDGVVSSVGQIDPDSDGTGEVFNGDSNSATGERSHAEGISTSAQGVYSHAEGLGSFAIGNISHVEGSDGQAVGDISHVEGSQCVANGHTSHAEGNITITTNSNEHAQGTCNVSNTGSLDSDKTIHSIGIGLKYNQRKNAQEVMTNGDHYIIGVGNYDGTNYSEAKTLQEVINGKQDTLVSGTSIKTINGQSILGEGNIDIESGSTGISDAPSDGKKYVRSNAAWVEETTVDTSVFATKQEVTSQLQSKQNLIQVEQISESEKEIQPDVYYMFGEKETLTITLASTDSNYYHEYMFEFNSGATPTTLNVPKTIKWENGTMSTIEANRTYQVSIVNNLAVIKGFWS